MRGKARWLEQYGRWQRITPAHAGKRRRRAEFYAREEDHPRPCGEKHYARPARRSALGSPPPMRGKGRRTQVSELKRGITPAHAGKRPPRRLASSQIRDHPRPCGEKLSCLTQLDLLVGSPPPMRGKETIAGLWRSETRITPAHAGKRLRKRRNTGIFVFQISRFHSVSHTPDTSYGNRPALYVRRLHRTPAALQASKAYDRARWAAYAWLFAVCPHTGS